MQLTSSSIRQARHINLVTDFQKVSRKEYCTRYKNDQKFKEKKGVISVRDKNCHISDVKQYMPNQY